jgi:hypothetical protein
MVTSFINQFVEKEIILPDGSFFAMPGLLVLAQNAFECELIMSGAG